MANRMTRAACICAVGLFLLVAGCTPRKGPVKAPPPPPPQTPEDVARDIEQGLRPLFDFVATAKRQTPVPPELGESLLSYLREAQKKYDQNPVGKEGMRQVVRRLE